MEEKAKKNVSGLAIAGLVLSVVAIIFAIIPLLNVVSYIAGGLAVIFCIIGIIKSAKKVLPIIGLALAVAAMILSTVINGAVVKGVQEALEDSSFVEELEDISFDFEDVSFDFEDLF